MSNRHAYFAVFDHLLIHLRWCEDSEYKLVLKNVIQHIVPMFSALKKEVFCCLF